MGTRTGEKVCLCCRRRHEEKYVEVEEHALYKGVQVAYTARYKYCERAEKLLNDTEVIAMNYMAMREAYEKREAYSSVIGE